MSSPFDSRRLFALTTAGFVGLSLCIGVLITGCAQSPEKPDAVVTQTVTAASAKPEMDATLLRNLAEIQKQPGIADLDWRQPKEMVASGSSISKFERAGFAEPGALSDAVAYHEQKGGAGMMVWHAGKLVAEHYRDGFSADQHFASYSMHKSALAVAVLAAVEDGLIGSIDDPVGGYIEEWSNLPQGAITLRQLLTHSSGLEHFAMGGQSPKAANLALSSQVSATALSFELAAQPGTEFNYNNVNSQIVGIALERALKRDNRRYADYLSARVWRPLGNAQAALWLEAAEGSPRYYSGLEAGLADWLRLGVMIANGGRAGDQQVLSPDSMRLLTQASNHNPAYGLHIWRGEAWEAARRYGPTTALTVSHESPFLARDVWFLDGFGGQRVYVIPSAKLVVARAGEVDFTYDDSIIVNTLLRGLQKEQAQTAFTRYQEPEANEVYQGRFERLLKEARAGRGLAGYDPLIELRGAPAVQPLSRRAAASSWISDKSKAWLDTFGADTNSSAILVWHKDEVIYENYFNGAASDSLIISRSLSKPISVIAVGRAIEAGFIPSLDEPVDTYLHEWRDSEKSSMTLRHLLQMRSGLARQGNSMESDHYLNRAYLHPFHIEVILHEYPMTHEPGTRYDYSNANSELIAPIIERATGRRYEDWVSESVLAPLGAGGGQIWVNRPGGIVHSGCCALLPAETFLRLSVLLMNDGHWGAERLLPEGFVKAVTTPTATNPHTGMGMYVAGPYVENRGAANPDVPFGHTLHSEPYLDRDLYLFDGNGHQVSYHIPRHDLIILRVGVRPPKEVVWDNTALPNYLLRQLAAETGAELIPQPSP